MAFSKGAKPSAKHKLALTQPAHTHPVVAPLLALLMGAGAAAPPAPQTAKHPVHWLSQQPEDQGGSSACTAHSLSQGLLASCGARGISLGFSGPPSPLHFYSCSGGIERAAATPLDPLPALTDTGRELADNITALMTCGAVPMGSLSQCPTPDGRFSDLWTTADVASPPQNVNQEPSVQGLQAGAFAVLKGAYTVDVTSATALQQCAASLDGGIALYLGFSCGQAFEALTVLGIAQPTPSTDTTAGGHAVTVVSYRINAAGEYEWLIRNSWGASWPAAANDNDPPPPGCVWASSAWLLAVWEVWLLDESLLTAARKAAA